MVMRRRTPRREPPAFEESFNGEWGREAEIIEVPLDNRTLFYLGIVIFVIGFIVIGRVAILSTVKSGLYRSRAEVNSSQVERTAAPRGLIYDRGGTIIAENHPAFFALLDTNRFFQEPALEEKTLAAVERILGLSPEELWVVISAKDPVRIGEKVVLSVELTQPQLVQLRELNLPTIEVANGFKREYKDGPVFAPVIGYTGMVDQDDLERFPQLSGQDFIGKAGVEAFYDQALRGAPGVLVKLRDAAGASLEAKEEQKATAGEPLHLTLDAELQRYFYARLEQGLRDLGRTIGVGVALDPQSGEVLALVTIPSYDNNLFVSAGKNKEKQELLSSPLRPLFNRAVSGMYSPGSTIKPLVALAALAEGVVTPDRQIYSPGYLEVPDPYDPSTPTRFLDWRPHGWVDLEKALAQSSNVYFYTVGGGHADIKGLGINRLREWWQRFRLGEILGIDIPGEAKGLLPSVQTREEKGGSPWLLGDTYNVSIGQGDLLLTPLQLIGYIAAIANDGRLYRPFVVKNGNQTTVLADLSHLLPHIREVQRGMRGTVRLPVGTAYSLHDLPFSVAAKTGTAQVKNNTQENAFFVGYAPAEKPRIAILVLVEQSREGSLNTVPIAKDVLNWYYSHRLQSSYVNL